MKSALSLRQAAGMIGVSASTLRRWIDDGEGPRAFIKQGPKRDTVRIMREDMAKFIRRNSRGAS